LRDSQEPLPDNTPVSKGCIYDILYLPIFSFQCCFGLSGNHLNSALLQFHTSVITLSGPGEKATILRGDVHSIAVVGNNGAGKTRFAHHTTTSAGARKVVINALRDLGYHSHHPTPLLLV
jgi:hypothetical protein